MRMPDRCAKNWALMIDGLGIGKEGYELGDVVS